MAGRKSLKEEIKIVERMAELTGPVFDYLKLCISSGDKKDKQWAIEQMMKLYPKALPTEIATDPDSPFQIMAINYITPKENAEPNPDNKTNVETASSKPSAEQPAS